MHLRKAALPPQILPTQLFHSFDKDFNLVQSGADDIQAWKTIQKFLV